MLLTVSVVSSLSFSIYFMTETWYVINELQQQSWLGVVLIATTLPRVLLMSIGGVYADKWNRLSIMFYSLLFRGLLLIGMSVVFYFGYLNVQILVLFAPVFGLIDAFFGPANQSLLPHIISKEQLMRGNSIVQTSNQIVLLTGLMIAGILIVTVSYQAIFPILAFCFIITGVIVKFIDHKEIKKGLNRQSSFKDFLE